MHSLLLLYFLKVPAFQSLIVTGNYCDRWLAHVPSIRDVLRDGELLPAYRS